jgi:hypothetical protein
MDARWCYSMERYLNVLKKYVRNRAWLEAYMAFGYMYDEVLGFCTILNVECGIPMKRKRTTVKSLNKKPSSRG